MIEPIGHREATKRVVRTIEPWQRLQHVERCGASTDEDARVAYFARTTLDGLVQLGVTDAIIRRVVRGMDFAFRRSWDAIATYRELSGRFAPLRSNSEFRSMHRLEALLRAKQGGSSWEEAIDAAVLAVPFADNEGIKNVEPYSPRPDHKTLLPDGENASGEHALR